MGAFLLRGALAKTEFDRDGAVYFQKLQRFFGQSVKFSLCEIEHGLFRPLFVDEDSAKVMIVEFYPKSLKIDFPAGERGGTTMQNQTQTQTPLTTKDTKDTKEDKSLPRVNVDRQEQIRQRAEALVRRIGETCDELDRLAEADRELGREGT